MTTHSRAVAHVIARLLHRLRGDAGQLGVRRFCRALHLQQREHAEEELPNDREAEIALRQLDHQRVPEVDRVAEIRERVLVATLPFHLAGELEQQRRLADQVERDVGERDVLLEDRPVAAPLRQPMAEHQPVVAEAEQVLETATADRRHRATTLVKDANAARHLVELRMPVRLVVARDRRTAPCRRASTR